MTTPGSDRTRPWRGTAWLLSSLLGLALLGLFIVASREEADALRDLRLAGSHAPGDLPTLVAEQQGFFKRHGLNVEILREDGGSAALAALKQGRADFALMSLTTLVLDRLAASGPPSPEDPVMLASLVYAARLNHVVTKSSGGIREPLDLEEQRVGLHLGSCAEYLWWLFTTHHGIDPARVTLVDLPPVDQPNALLSGEVKALVTQQTWSTLLARHPQGELEVLPGVPLSDDNWVLVTSRKMATRHDDLSRRLLLAYLEAIEYIGVLPDKASHLPLVDDVLATESAVGELPLPNFGLNLDWSVLFDMQQVVQWAESRRGERPAPPSILDWIARKPLSEVAPAHVGIPASTTRDLARIEEARTP